jgi:hypothetical protein
MIHMRCRNVILFVCVGLTMRTDSANIVPEDGSICDGLRHHDHDVRLLAL